MGQPVTQSTVGPADVLTRTRPAAGHASGSLGGGWAAEPLHLGPERLQLFRRVQTLAASPSITLVLVVLPCGHNLQAVQSPVLSDGPVAGTIPAQRGSQQGLPKLSTLLLHDNILAGQLPAGWETRSGPPGSCSQAKIPACGVVMAGEDCSLGAACSTPPQLSSAASVCLSLLPAKGLLQG